MNLVDIFKDYCPKLFGVLRRRGLQRQDAEDVVQETFARLHVYVQRGERITDPKAFVTTVALNLSIDHQRREGKYLFDERAIEELLLPDLTPGPEDELAAEELLARADELLDNTVGARACKAFALHCEGRTHEEIARRLLISTDTVARDLADALRVLSLEKQRLRPV